MGNRDAGGANGRIHVLLVDDDGALVSAVTRGLEREGFSVVSAGSSEEAIRIAADLETRIDVVVMDIVLPDSWGGQVAMEQGLFRPAIPVIFISGHSEGDAVLTASSGQEETTFLAKPFSIEELAGKIREVSGKGGAK
jgi:two-component system, cell cycle sensor histidine kinase and response regulator CckA